MRAGEFALVTASSWIDRLHQAGHLNRDQHDVAMRLQELFEASGIRPRLVGGCYDGAQVMDGPSYAGGLLEALSASEMRAWRDLGRLLAMVPRQCRAIVSATCCWDLEPWDVRVLQHGLWLLAGAIRGGPARGTPVVAEAR